jgi:ABC-type proline/glycine betaine transport system ATPase subunit
MRVEISSLVRAAGATTIYITHDQANALADRVGVLERGRLVQLATPKGSTPVPPPDLSLVSPASPASYRCESARWPTARIA